MNALEPGDMATVIRGPQWSWLDDVLSSKALGKNVIVLDTYQGELGTYWRVAGLPKVRGIHATCLRKIPPAPIEYDIPTECTVPA